MEPLAPQPQPQPEPAYEWASALDIINRYHGLDEAAQDGWAFEGGAFRRIVNGD